MYNQNIKQNIRKEYNMNNIFNNPRFYLEQIKNVRISHQLRKSITGKSMITVWLTKLCPADCKHCFSKSNMHMESGLKEKYHFSDYGIQQLIKFINDSNNSYVMMSGGGEPMVHKKAVNEIVRNAKTERIVIVTNGIWARDCENAEMTIKELLKQGTIMLKGENLDSPSIKARLLLQDILNKNRQYLLVHDNEKVNEETAKKYLTNIEKVKTGTPIEHITHLKEFMKMNFYVNENVLIPRQDTEILVEEAIKIAKRINAKKILDLCTGSGAIAISIAKYIENAEITATDISSEALRVAKKNAINNEVENKITFIQSDLFKSIVNTKFDMIV